MSNVTNNESKRHGELLDLLQQKQTLSIEEIAHHFDISQSTARRDILKLESKGKLARIKKGVAWIDQDVNLDIWTPLTVVNSANYSEKIRIAKEAASLCQKDDSIIINCGTTAFLLGQEICGKDIKVITNFFPLINYLVERRHGNIIVIGGQYYRERNLFLSSEQQSDNLYTGKFMFTSGSGLTSDGLFKDDSLSAMAEYELIPKVHKLVALVDSSKLGKRSGSLFAPTEKLDIVITGKNADPDIIDQLRANGVEVHLV